MDQHVVGELGARGGIPERKLKPRRRDILVKARDRPPEHLHLWVVSKVLPNTRKLVNDRYAYLDQVMRRPYPREQEYLRRADWTSAQDHLIAICSENLVTAFDFDTRCPIAVEHHAVNEAVPSNRQIESVARLPQVAYVRAPANPIGMVEWGRTHARRVGVVMVRAVREAIGAAGIVESLLVDEPFVRLESSHDDGPVRAVKVVRKVCVCLQLAKRRKKLLKAPLVVSPRSPSIVVVGYTPQKYHGVDCGGPAGDPSPRDQHWHGVVGRPGHEGPPMLAGDIVHHAELFYTVAVFDFVWEQVDVGVVGPGLEKQDRDIRVLGQTSSQYGPRGTRSYDYVVIFHLLMDCLQRLRLLGGSVAT